jgi:hypothetical protein
MLTLLSTEMIVWNDYGYVAIKTFSPCSWLIMEETNDVDMRNTVAVIWARFHGVQLSNSLFFCVMLSMSLFVLCLFSLVHFIVCPSTINSVWLRLCYFQTFLKGIQAVRIEFFLYIKSCHYSMFYTNCSWNFS